MLQLKEETQNSGEKTKTQGKNSTFGEQTLRLWHQVMLKKMPDLSALEKAKITNLVGCPVQRLKAKAQLSLNLKLALFKALPQKHKAGSA